MDNRNFEIQFKKQHILTRNKLRFYLPEVVQQHIKVRWTVLYRSRSKFQSVKNILKMLSFGQPTAS